MRLVELFELEHYMRKTLIGYIDPIGNFVINLRPHHIDQFDTEALSFFARRSFQEKSTELFSSLS